MRLTGAFPLPLQAFPYIVLAVDLFHDEPVRLQLIPLRAAPGLRVGLRIINREVDFERAGGQAAKALDVAHRFRVRGAEAVEPGFLALPHGLDDQRISIPSAGRVPHPGWLPTGGMAPSVRVDHAAL